MVESLIPIYKIIDCRTRETLIPRIYAQSHTQAEQRAKELLPGIYTSASLLTDKRIVSERAKKKRVKKT